jgi:positive regulator of sigma E activity
METATQTARITQTKDSSCELEISDNCDHCSLQQGCSSSILKQIIGKKIIQLDNPLRGKVGDEVIVSLDKNILIALLLRTYLIPLVGFFVGSGCGLLLFSEAGSIFGGFLGLSLGILLLKTKKYPIQYQPKIVKVIE